VPALKSPEDYFSLMEWWNGLATIMAAHPFLILSKTRNISQLLEPRSPIFG
jgi:hypothetical protein